MFNFKPNEWQFVNLQQLSGQQEQEQEEQEAVD